MSYSTTSSLPKAGTVSGKIGTDRGNAPLVNEGLTVALRDVSLEFADPSRSRKSSRVVLSGVNLSVSSGEIVSIVGRSGSGKSSLLRIVADLIPPSSGTVTVDGDSPAIHRGKGAFSFVFQDPVLLPWRSVDENITLPLQVMGKAAEQDALARVLNQVGLVDYADFYPSQLSGGMRSRVAIARAFITEPSLLLLDECFADLDEITRDRLVFDLLAMLSERRTTALFVTHSLTEAVFIADRVLVLGGSPANIVADIPVALPKPRTPEHRESPGFFTALHKIRTHLEGAYIRK